MEVQRGDVGTVASEHGDEHVDKGENDHSVYGLGLKAGSFNHCTSITVITKKDELIKKTLNLKDGITDNMPSCIEHKFVKKSFSLRCFCKKVFKYVSDLVAIA